MKIKANLNKIYFENKYINNNNGVSRKEEGG